MSSEALFFGDALMFVSSLGNLLALRIKAKKACTADSLYFC